MVDIKIKKFTNVFSFIYINDYLQGIKILNYYSRSRNFRRIQKEGTLPMIKENFNIGVELEFVFNENLSLYCFNETKTIKQFRAGCLIANIDAFWNMKKTDMEIVFNKLHTERNKKEFEKFIAYRKFLKNTLDKVPLKKEWRLKKDVFFKRTFKQEFLKREF